MFSISLAFGIATLKLGAIFTYLPILNWAPRNAADSSFAVFMLFREYKSSNRTNKDMHWGRFTMANREFKSAELKRLPYPIFPVR